MYRIMFENYRGWDECFSGTLEECLENLSDWYNSLVGDDQEEDVFVVNENDEMVAYVNSLNFEVDCLV